MSTGYINLPVTGSNPTTTSLWSQAPTYPEDLSWYVIDIDHFTVNGAPLDARTNGAGAAYQQADGSIATTGINSTENAIGVAQIQTGTATTGRCYIGIGRPENLGGALRFGKQAQRFGVRLTMPLLSTGTETYTLFLGWTDTGASTPNNGVFFRYTDSVNSGNWEYCKSIGGVVTATDTGVACVANNITGAYQTFEITVNSAGTEANFYIDGVLVGTHTTLTTATNMACGLNILKSAGTSNRLVFMDAFYFANERSNSR